MSTSNRIPPEVMLAAAQKCEAKPHTTPIASHEGKKYLRVIQAADEDIRIINVDVYSVLEAFDVSCPARAHAIKKLLCCGSRGKGDAIADLQGVLAAVNRAVENWSSSGKRCSGVPRMTMLTPGNEYPGSKGLDGIYQWIIGLMPTHSVYAEPFCGKAAILRNKPPALRSYAIDLDPEVAKWLERLAPPGTIVTRGDGISWLQTNRPFLGPDALVYLDPPYLHQTRVKKRLYKFEMSDRQHRQLLRVVMRLDCNVMISGYDSQLYRETLSHWHVFTHPAITRGGTIRIEHLWTNFDPSAASPAMALDYSCLGRNFRERERVNRKIKRWTGRLLQLPAAERRAILLAIIDAGARHGP